MIGRDSFSLPEVDIFNVVKEWHELNSVETPRPSLIDKIRLPLMKLEEMLKEVGEIGFGWFQRRKFVTLANWWWWQRKSGFGFGYWVGYYTQNLNPKPKT